MYSVLSSKMVVSGKRKPCILKKNSFLDIKEYTVVFRKI